MSLILCLTFLFEQHLMTLPLDFSWVQHQHLQENNVLKDYLNNLMAKVLSVNDMAVQG